MAPKPQLAQAMLTRALEAGVPAAWGTGERGDGHDAPLRHALENRRQPYVLAIKSDLRLLWEGGPIWAQTLAGRLGASAGQTLSAGEGAKGPRRFDGAYLSVDAPEQEGFWHGLLGRRRLADPTQRAYYFVFASPTTPLATLVRVAGTRGTIEVAFESAKGEVGLDEYEVRSWHGWYRPITLALLAHALLCVLRQHSLEPSVKGGRNSPPTCLRPFQQSRGLCCR